MKKFEYKRIYHEVGYRELETRVVTRRSPTLKNR